MRPPVWYASSYRQTKGETAGGLTEFYNASDLDRLYTLLVTPLTDGCTKYIGPFCFRLYPLVDTTQSKTW